MQRSRISAPPSAASDGPNDSAREPVSQLVFVYGSLKRGFRNHAELAGAVFEGEARTAASYGLVVVGDYPALTAGRRSVHGELYRASSALLARLDDFEGEDYARAPITLDDGRTAEAYLATALALSASIPFDADAWRE